MRLVTAVLATMLLASPVLAQDAGTGSAVVSTVDGGSVLAMSPEAVVGSPSTEAAPSGMMKSIFQAVKEGNWWVAAAGFLILVVGVMRKFGKKIHDWLPDSNPLDKPLWFFFDTKVGAWVLNWLTALAGGLGTAWAAGATIDWSIWKSVVMVSTTGTMLVELWNDLKEWWETRKAKQAAAAGITPPAAPPAVGG